MNSQFQNVAPNVQPSPVNKTMTKVSEGLSERPYQHIRSCLFCRSRKVKCDRQKPCAHCLRTGTECVYPSGPGRAPKRPRRQFDKRILDRLADLEAMVRRLDTTEASGQPARETPADSATEPEDQSSQIEQQFGRLVIDNTRSCYVSNILWASLGDEIEELRDLLYEPASDEDSEAATVSSADTTTSLGCNAAIMGFQTLAQSLRAYHPPLAQSVALFEIFKHSVAPLVHIFHMPTLVTSYWDSVASPESLDRNTEALLFSIYYSTVISMESQQCEQVLGFSRAAAVKHYQFAVEQAMARANLLNTQSVVLIQAVVLFLSALRNEDASRTAWSMTALIFHIAQAMGLHRDGASFGLRPLETEIRRRLWWHICLLDIRSSEYHGCEPIVHESMFDTRMPLNINDSDLTPDMTVPPAEREESTEMTFCLIRCEAMRIVWKTGYVPPAMRRAGQPAVGLSLAERASLAKDLQQRLQERYLKHCDTSRPFFQACVTVARLIIARNWLVVYYPYRQKDDNGTNLPSSPIRDQLFAVSVKVLELSYELLTSPALAQWTWHSMTHVKWHAAAIVLSEICLRPPSQDCDRAWEYTQTLYNHWKMKESKGNLWRPINRLMAKARYVREMQQKKTSLWRVAGTTRPSASDTSISDITADLIDGYGARSNESLEPILDNLDPLDWPDLGLEYAYPLGIDYTMPNFDGSPMDMEFGIMP